MSTRIVSYPVRLALPEIPVECFAGTPLSFRVPVLGGDGEPVNRANVISARAQVRTAWDSPVLLHSWTTDVPAGMFLDGTSAAGVVVKASGAETAIWQQQWPSLAVEWDVEVVDADGEPHRLCRASSFIVYPEITQEI